jgi:copper homeostasis protein
MPRPDSGVPAKGVGLEICIDCVESARAAAQGGASSVELCANLVDGGTTPSAGMVAQVVAAVGESVAVQVIIRPRGGDFLFSDDEVEVMLMDIDAAKAAGAAGAVIGALTPQGMPDLALTERLAQRARPEMAVTFHRAIDLAPDPVAATRALLPLKLDRILTSGGAATAPEGLATIAEMVEAVAATGAATPVIVPGGGLSTANIAAVVAATKVRMVHASLRSTKDGGMVFRKPGVFMGGDKKNTPDTEFTSRTADLGMIRDVISTLAQVEAPAAKRKRSDGASL